MKTYEIKNDYLDLKEYKVVASSFEEAVEKYVNDTFITYKKELSGYSGKIVELHIKCLEDNIEKTLPSILRII